MIDDPYLKACIDFVQDRIDESSSLPTLLLAAQQILNMVLLYDDDAMFSKYTAGYMDAADDALFAISGVWRYHPDYEGWADDE